MTGHCVLYSSILSASLLLSAAAPEAGAPGADRSTPEADPEKAIATVMQEAMTSGLAKRVAKGEEPVEGRKALLELFQSLEGTTPPLGSQTDWDERIAAMIAAADDAVADKEGYPKRLRKAVNCGACHKAHRE